MIKVSNDLNGGTELVMTMYLNLWHQKFISESNLDSISTRGLFAPHLGIWTADVS